jgi:hypothetical protein
MRKNLIVLLVKSFTVAAVCNNLFGLISHQFGGIIHNQPHRALVGCVSPHPFRYNDEAIAKTNEVHDMDEYPYQPGDPAGYA